MRKRELYKACGMLGVPEENITVLRYTRLRDDPRVRWREELVSDIVQGTHLMELLKVQVKLIGIGFVIMRLKLSHLNMIELFSKLSSSLNPSFISNTWCRTTLTSSSPSTAAASVDTRTTPRCTMPSLSSTSRKGTF